MKKRIKTNWQFIASVTTISLIFIFAESLSALVQKTHQAGDKIEVLFYGTWYPSKIIEVKDRQYKIRDDHVGTTATTNG